VWLIFVVVLLWTCFPTVFAVVMSTLYIPLTLAALGIIARGSSFAYRKVTEQPGLRQLFGGLFALSSVLTPFFLGTVAGAVAFGRVPLGVAVGDPLTSWTGPSSLLGGVLAVLACAYLAAVYLCADAVREREPEVAAAFRARALATGVAVQHVLASCAGHRHRCANRMTTVGMRKVDTSLRIVDVQRSAP
jgi:cytochrome d ubiquinol oxidase subunit II